MIKDKLAVCAWGLFLAAALWLLFPEAVSAAGAEALPGDGAEKWLGLAYFSSALAVGLACIASAYAVARIGSAGIGAVSEKPELAGRALIFLGLAEGIAIYGLIIAIMILNKI